MTQSMCVTVLGVQEDQKTVAALLTLCLPGQSRDRKPSVLCQGQEGMGNGELLFHGYQASLLHNEKSSKDGLHKTCLYLRPHLN